MTTKRTMLAQKRALESLIRAHGFDLIYQPYCECARTPGLLGQIRGVTDRELKRVRISEKANPTLEEMIDILQHELAHLDNPDWDCGGRDVLGRGGKHS